MYVTRASLAGIVSAKAAVVSSNRAARKNIFFIKIGVWCKVYSVKARICGSTAQPLNFPL
jgi:hypothetical protein